MLKLRIINFLILYCSKMEEINTHWWYEIDGENKGPVKDEDIIKMISSKYLKPENLVWKQGTEHWVNLKSSTFSEYFKNNNPSPVSGSAVNNNIVWWLAFAPLIGQILEGFFLEMFYPEPSLDYDNLNSIENYTHYLTNTDFNAFWFITLALNFYLSYRDEERFKKSGYDTTKLGTTFLIPVYLYKRAELLKQNNAYFWVWIILFILTLY